VVTILTLTGTMDHFERNKGGKKERDDH